MSEAPPGDIPFSEAADRLSTDHDVLMCYELLLGRDPENSFVIQESKTQPVRRVMEAFLRSDEFANNVASPFRTGRVVAHDALSLGPSAEQILWLGSVLRLPDNVIAALRAARDWRSTFVPLSEVPGFFVGGAPQAEAHKLSGDTLAILQVRMEKLQAKLQQVTEAISDLRADMRELAHSYTQNGGTFQNHVPEVKVNEG